uniref:SJCHGC06806 protein n=1 Tax=Schistosoma japonicum TaxID=6182 RepID=Q3KTI6_SCHJA|nr:SJCHGC06806 protein [Schistosoma japonicum]
MQKKNYQRSTLNRVLNIAHGGIVITCLAFGIALTGFTVFSLSSYYIFKRPAIKKQQRDYAKALVFKDKREKELGLRD